MPEFFPIHPSVYNSQCTGCQRHKQDIMITFPTEGEKGGIIFNDVFMSQQDAIRLYAELGKRITENYEYLPIDHGRPNQIDNIKK